MQFTSKNGKIQNPEAQDIDLRYKKKIENYHADYEWMKYNKVLQWENTWILHEMNWMMELCDNNCKAVVI